MDREIIVENKVEVVESVSITVTEEQAHILHTALGYLTPASGLSSVYKALTKAGYGDRHTRTNTGHSLEIKPRPVW
jgi:hypothetical protein